MSNPPISILFQILNFKKLSMAGRAPTKMGDAKLLAVAAATMTPILALVLNVGDSYLATGTLCHGRIPSSPHTNNMGEDSEDNIINNSEDDISNDHIEWKDDAKQPLI